MTEFVAGQRVNVHYMQRLHLEPEWVVVGVRVESTGEFAALAGVGLTHATLVQTARRLGSSEQPINSLRAELRGYVIGFGATYAEALRDLTRRWNPDQPPATDPALES